jgi:hypothetical protein
MAERSRANSEARAVAAAWIPSPAILAGEAAISNRRRALDDWLAIGKAFDELEAEAMRQSNSNEAKGRRYSAAYTRLRLSPEIANLHKIGKNDRGTVIWLHQNEGAVRCWYATLSQKQRDRWTRPQTIKLQYKRMTGASQQDHVGGKPATKRQSAWDRAKAQIAERNAAIARLEREIEAVKDEMLSRDEAALGRVDRKNAEIARLRKERDAARTRLSSAQNAEIARLTRLSSAQNTEIARLRKERDAARTRLSALQPRLSALERASPTTEAKIRRQERNKVLLRLTEFGKAAAPVSASHIVGQLRRWLKQDPG